MTESERRLFALEQFCYYRLPQQIQTLQDLVNALRNALNQGYWGGGGGGSSAGFYVAFPTSSVSGATWSGGVPTAGVPFSAVVCQVSYNGSSQTITNLGSQSCVNWLAASLVANQGIVVGPDGAGGYGVYSQSCV